MFGTKSYQERARRALPILVRQARSKKPIYYEALANELSMPNPRNLNFVLGSVGATLNELAAKKHWNEEIPHIQSLVINQRERLPGYGFDGFLADKLANYQNLTRTEKRAYLDGYWIDIFAYPYWSDVLEECGLEDTDGDASAVIERGKRGAGGGGGEGPEHEALKLFIRDNPSSVGLPLNFPPGTAETPLPSGDRVDVLFSNPEKMLGVEVKSSISNDADLIRGLFQCVKYRAVMKAERGFKSAIYSVDAVLAIGKPLPHQLHALRNSLGIRVIEFDQTRPL